MSKKLNILQLINVRWYNACAYYAISLSCALKRRGHRVIVAGDPFSPPILQAKKLRLSVFEDIFLSHINPWMIGYNVKRMVDLVRRERIDIINAHRGESHLVAALAKVFFKRKVPLIRTRGDARFPQANLLNRYLNDRLTDKIITTCQILRESYINDLRIPAAKVVNIGVGIDHELFSPRDEKRTWGERLSIPEESLVVGMVGRLSPVKGHRYFIRSAEYVLKQMPHTIFLICGQDAQMTADQLKEEVKAMKMEKNFRFIGKVKDVRGIISLFDIGVVASVGSETICRVALEYMSMGKPVVATKVNAIPEVIDHGVNGLVVEPENAQKLGLALVELLQDEQKRKRFGKKSRDRVRDEFTLDIFAQKTEKVYLELLD